MCSIRCVRWWIGLAAILTGSAIGIARAQVEGVEVISTTVGDLDRSIAYYTQVLTFEKVSEDNVSGPEIDRDLGLTGTR
jgi:hypothetical protein